MILGESGAGKSTLLNALLGHDTLATGGVRERDDQGRHTTVARVMVALPGEAGVIADAPGLRSLPLVGHERGLARAFPEIVERRVRAGLATARIPTNRAAPFARPRMPGKSTACAWRRSKTWRHPCV